MSFLTHSVIYFPSTSPIFPTAFSRYFLPYPVDPEKLGIKIVYPDSKNKYLNAVKVELTEPWGPPWINTTQGCFPVDPFFLRTKWWIGSSKVSH